MNRFVDFSLLLHANYTVYMIVLYLLHAVLLVFLVGLLGYATMDNWFFNYLVEKKQIL